MAFESVKQELLAVRSSVELDFYATLLGVNNDPDFNPALDEMIDLAGEVPQDVVDAQKKVDSIRSIVTGALVLGVENPESVAQFLADLYACDEVFVPYTDHVDTIIDTLSFVSGSTIIWQGGLQ